MRWRCGYFPQYEDQELARMSTEENIPDSGRRLLLLFFATEGENEQGHAPKAGALSPYSNRTEGGSYEGNRIFRSRV